MWQERQSYLECEWLPENCSQFDWEAPALRDRRVGNFWIAMVALVAEPHVCFCSCNSQETMRWDLTLFSLFPYWARRRDPLLTISPNPNRPYPMLLSCTSLSKRNCKRVSEVAPSLLGLESCPNDTWYFTYLPVLELVLEATYLTTILITTSIYLPLSLIF